MVDHIHKLKILAFDLGGYRSFSRLFHVKKMNNTYSKILGVNWSSLELKDDDHLVTFYFWQVFHHIWDCLADCCLNGSHGSVIFLTQRQSTTIIAQKIISFVTNYHLPCVVTMINPDARRLQNFRKILKDYPKITILPMNDLFDQQLLNWFKTDIMAK